MVAICAHYYSAVFSSIFQANMQTTNVLLFIKGNVLRIQIGDDASRFTPLLRLEDLNNDNSLQTIKEFRQNMCADLPTLKTVSHINHWVKECQNRHIECRNKGTTKLPTRLLRISSDDVFLIETSSQISTTIHYMTLSHRWPKSGGMKLTKNTMIHLERGLAIKSLPPLFRDICELSMSLGYIYIWIDALCIVQDDDQDWMKESSRMVEVYAHSQLNMIAGASQQDESLFHKRNPLMLTPCIITGSKLSQALDLGAIFTFSSDETAEIARLATESRAWILQECELSPRMVYFGDVEIIWECSTKLQSESSRIGGVNWTSADNSERPRNIKSKLARFRQDYIGLTEARCGGIWTGLVSKYTSLDITFEVDRLVAISGLSQYLQHEASDQLGEYRAGLWEIGFEQQLLWRDFTGSGIQPSSTYLAPSWSWASHVSRIAYNGPQAGAKSVSSFVESLQVSVTPTDIAAIHGRLKGWLLLMLGKPLSTLSVT